MRLASQMTHFGLSEDDIYARCFPRPHIVKKFHDVYAEFFIKHGHGNMFAKYAKHLIKSYKKIHKNLDAVNGVHIWIAYIFHQTWEDGSQKRFGHPVVDPKIVH